MKPWLMLLNLKKVKEQKPFLFKFKHIFSIFIMISLLLTIHSLPSLLTSVQSMFFDMAATLNHWCRFPEKVFSESLSAVKAHFNVQKQNQTLREENTVLRKRYYQALALAAENHRLRQKLRIIEDSLPSFITARVIGGSDSPYQKSMFINGGKKAGIHLKSAVLSDQQILGRIIETGTYASRVLLVTDPQSHVPVVLEKSGLQGILSGTSFSYMTIKISEKSFQATDKPHSFRDSLQSIDSDVRINIGEYVFSSGQGGIFPAGFVVGRVIAIHEEEIFVESLQDLSQLEYVQILKPAEISSYD